MAKRKIGTDKQQDAQRIERVLTNIFNSANQIMLSVVKLSRKIISISPSVTLIEVILRICNPCLEKKI